MEKINSDRLVWAKIPQYPFLPGRICNEPIPCNNIIDVSVDPEAVCVFFFGIHEYAWIDRARLYDYREYRQHYQNQRLHKMRRYYLFEAIKEIEKFISDVGFRYSILGSIQKISGNIREAIKSLRFAIDVGTDPITYSEYVHCLLIACDWMEYEHHMRSLENVVLAQLRTKQKPCVDSHTSIFYPFRTEIRLAIARHDSAIDISIIIIIIIKFNRNVEKAKRLKIGYVSSDFRDHSLAHLFQNIPAMHDRNRFEVYCYALNPKDDSIFYKKIANGSDHFINLSKKNDVMAADRINADRIDILINLNGHTEGGRNEIFAFRPAPIAALWLGFPGTMGSKYIDYFIADAVSAPIDNAQHFTEKLAHMPHTYFIGDHRQMFPHLIQRIVVTDSSYKLENDRVAVINGVDLFSTFANTDLLDVQRKGKSGKTKMVILTEGETNKMAASDEYDLSLFNIDILNGRVLEDGYQLGRAVFTARAHYGIPPRGIVFCNFNQLYKIYPSTFKSWLKILKAVPNSFLWLLRYPVEGEANLRKAAFDSGFEEDYRIIFSDVAPKEEHVRRCQLADLCLDTNACNGHTTTMDILWSGTPVLAMLGKTFASRVSASILNAFGCPELITNDLDDYEKAAINFGNNPDQLRVIQRKVFDLRFSSPLFDCQHFARDLEKVYETMWENYMLNKNGQHITDAKCCLKNDPKCEC